MARRPVFRLVLAAAAALALVLGVGAWKLLRVDEIPDELEAVEPERDPSDLSISHLGDGPPLALRALRGSTVFLLVEGQASFRSSEGKPLRRALNRWILPEDTRGFLVGDAAGFGLLRAKIAPYLAAWEKEVRFPVYLDFEGATLDLFKLPKGHTGLVVLGPDGDILLRHSGPMDDADLARLRELLGAHEPPPGPPAPSFRAGDLDNESCAGRPCLVAFVGVPLARNQIPFVEGGADLETMGEGAMDYMRRPEIRLVSTLTRLPLPAEVGAVLVGTVQGLDDELAGWTRVERAPEAAAAFGVEPGQSALFVIDGDGRLAVAETGAFPAYRMGRLEDVLGVEIRRGDAEDE